MILVTGATGITGSEVVRALQERGERLRAFVREPDKARRLFGDRVELALGDFADPQSVRAALDGVKTMFLSCADDPRRVEWEAGAIDAAAAAGVGRIVKLSTVGAAPVAPVAFWAWHGRVEQYLREADVAAVVLRSGFYMTNLLAAAEQVAHEARLYAPAGGAKVAMIDPRDVGAAAAAVLTTEGHDGETYVLTGPEAITWAGVAEALTVVAARAVDFVDVPDEAAKQGMIEAGLPDFVAEQLIAIFQQLRDGVGAQVTDTVERLTGHPPRDFAAFARDHAHVFEPAVVAL